jgi:hypothetical protein
MKWPMMLSIGEIIFCRQPHAGGTYSGVRGWGREAPASSIPRQGALTWRCKPYMGPDNDNCRICRRVIHSKAESRLGSSEPVKLPSSKASLSAINLLFFRLQKAAI